MSTFTEKVIRAMGATPVPDIDDWKKWWSTKLSLLAAALAAASTAYAAMPDGWVSALPGWVGTVLGGATVVVAVLIPLVRGIAQPALTQEK